MVMMKCTALVHLIRNESCFEKQYKYYNELEDTIHCKLKQDATKIDPYIIATQLDGAIFLYQHRAQCGSTQRGSRRWFATLQHR